MHLPDTAVVAMTEAYYVHRTGCRSASSLWPRHHVQWQLYAARSIHLASGGQGPEPACLSLPIGQLLSRTPCRLRCAAPPTTSCTRQVRAATAKVACHNQLRPATCTFVYTRCREAAMPFLLTTPPPPPSPLPSFHHSDDPSHSHPHQPRCCAQGAQASSTCSLQRHAAAAAAQGVENRSTSAVSSSSGPARAGPLTGHLKARCIDQHMSYMMPHPTHHASITMCTPVTTATVDQDNTARSQGTTLAQRHKTCHSGP